MSHKTIVLVDGENLLLRYEDMCAEKHSPKANVIHKSGVFVWSPDITRKFLYKILRVSYYTTFVGDNLAIEALCNEISSIQFRYTQSEVIGGEGTINPHVYKKETKTAKTKSVDINICIDALRHTYNRTVEKILLYSGDGDYLPLVKEVMRQGVIVGVGAFSKGCNPALKHVPDDFYDLDKVFFEERGTLPSDKVENDAPKD